MQIPDYSIAHDAGLIVIAAAVGLVSKIVWDWLKIRRNGNGSGASGALPASHWEHEFESLAERNEKSFENALRILVLPVMNRTNEILEEMKDNDKKLSEAIIKLSLRDEVRDQMRRGASA